MSNPSEAVIHSAPNAALDSLFTHDKHLLSADANERSLSHMLAIHLLSHFPNYQVDCEYNRDGFDAKKLMLAERPAKDDEVEAVTIFPDIIVHKRGENSQNILVIEMKKASSTVNNDYDIRKLKAFKSELRYLFAAHIVIGYTKTGILVRDVKWQ